MALRQSELEVLRKTMMAVVCRVLHCAKCQDEDWNLWHRRRRLEQETWLRISGSSRWDYAQSQQHWTWLGHVSRVPPTWPAHRLLQWRSQLWQEMHLAPTWGRTRGHAGTTANWLNSETLIWHHARAAWPGFYWMEITADQATWNAAALTFAAARCRETWAEARLDGDTSGESIAAESSSDSSSASWSTSGSRGTAGTSSASRSACSTRSSSDDSANSASLGSTASSSDG